MAEACTANIYWFLTVGVPYPTCLFKAVGPSPDDLKNIIELKERFKELEGAVDANRTVDILV